MNSLGNKKIMSENIQYFLNKNNIDRSQLCKDLDLNYSTVSEWISAKKYPRIDAIELMANYFGIQKSDLIESRENRQCKFEVSNDEQQYIAKYRKLDDIGKHTVNTVLDVEYNRVQTDTKNIRLNNQTDDKMVNIPLVARGEVKGVQQIQVNEKEFDEEFKKLIPSDLDL